MNTFIIAVSISVLGCICCMCTFCVGYFAGIEYAKETLKTEGEKDE